MRRLMAVLMTGCMLTGCTAFSPPRDIGTWDDFDECKTVDCVIDVYDEQVTGTISESGKRWKYMEGYKDTPLRILVDKGKLTITEISPWWLVPQIAAGTFLFGYAEHIPGDTGDTYSCHAAYMPLPNWQYFLVHELAHCQGYMESGKLDPSAWLINLQDEYTDTQQSIMKTEGVEHWYDTEFYKNEDATWHTEDK